MSDLYIYADLVRKEFNVKDDDNDSTTTTKRESVIRIETLMIDLE